MRPGYVLLKWQAPQSPCLSMLRESTVNAICFEWQFSSGDQRPHCIEKGARRGSRSFRCGRMPSQTNAKVSCLGRFTGLCLSRAEMFDD